MSALKTCPQCSDTYPFEQRFCPKDGATLRAAGTASDLVGQVIADRYHVLSKLGQGGMGQVYLAEHVRIKRKSAVKVLHPAMVNDPDAISRFNREASNASQIAHPNVAAIYDFGETSDGLIYLAMEYVDGEPLSRIIERSGPLPVHRASEIARQVADALEAAHEMGIVHRDLKPDNIMIATARDGSPMPKVVDFGIAKAMQSDEQNVTKTGLAIGTPEFMSPEQLGGDKLDGRTDTYSLGLVVFCMLTGKLPFPDVTSREALIARLTERPKTLAEIKGDVDWPTSLQDVMDRVLASRPAERYQRVSEFAAELTKAVQAMPRTALTATGTLVLQATRPMTPVEALELESRETLAGSAPSGTKRMVIAFAAMLLVAVASAAAVMHGRSSPAPAAAPLVSAHDSAAAAPAHDSVAAAPASAPGSAPGSAPDSAQLLAAAARPDSAPSASAGVTPADSSSASTPAAAPESSSTSAPAAESPPPPVDVDRRLSPIRDDLAVAKSRLEAGEYEGATVRLQSAAGRLALLGRRYRALPDVVALRRQLLAEGRHVHQACMAERDVALRRGDTAAPDCR